MKHIKNFKLFEGAEEWMELKPFDKDSLVELYLEMEYEEEGPFTISDVDDMRTQYSQLSLPQLIKNIATNLNCQNDEDSILSALKDQYPNGYILNQNNEFHQDGGITDEEDNDDN